MLQLQNFLNDNLLLSGRDQNISHTKLRVATTAHIHYIDVRDVVRIQSISNYSKLFFVNGQTIVVSKVLAHFDELLTGKDFLRIHRTHLVNLLHLKRYFIGNDTKVRMCNNEELPVSRRKKKLVQQRMIAHSL